MRSDFASKTKYTIRLDTAQFCYIGSGIVGWVSAPLYGHTYCKSMDQPGKVANPARGQLNRENEYFPDRVRA